MTACHVMELGSDNTLHALRRFVGRYKWQSANSDLTQRFACETRRQPSHLTPSYGVLESTIAISSSFGQVFCHCLDFARSSMRCAFH